MKGIVEINNVPNNPEKYIVASHDISTTELWYWGSWNDEDKAKKAAYEIGGVVLERLD